MSERLLRRQEALHRAELEKRQRLEWKAHQIQLQELNEAKRTISSNEKELAQLTERLHLKEAECDKLESEVKRLRSAESWRSVSPSSSIDDLTSHNVYSKRERDMAMRNSELSFRIRTLEDTLSITNKEKKSLETKLTATQAKILPLEEQNYKLKVQSNKLNETLRSREKKVNELNETLRSREKKVNELNEMLRSREKKVNGLSQKLLEVKSLYQSLQEVHEEQQKSLRKHVTQIMECKTQNQKLVLRNDKLKDAYDKLSERVKELEENNNLLQEQSFIMPSLPTSPLPSSTCTHSEDDDPLSVSSSSSQLQEHIDQLKFDKDEMEAKYEAKYEEIKDEYKDVREKYKALRHHFQQVKVKHEDSLLQIRRKFSHDQLALEKEVRLLRSAQAENLSDQNRSNYILVSLEEEKQKLLCRIATLEDFIIDQDDLMARRGLRWKEELNKLSSLLGVSVGESSNTSIPWQLQSYEETDQPPLGQEHNSIQYNTEQKSPHLTLSFSEQIWTQYSPEEQCLLLEKETQTYLEDSTTGIAGPKSSTITTAVTEEHTESAQDSIKDKLQYKERAVTKGHTESAQDSMKDELWYERAVTEGHTESAQDSMKEYERAVTERHAESAQDSMRNKLQYKKRAVSEGHAESARDSTRDELQYKEKAATKGHAESARDSTRDELQYKEKAVTEGHTESARDSMKDELQYKERKIQDLQNHVSKVKHDTHRLHLTIEELELKLAKAEQEFKLQSEKKDQLIYSLESQLQDMKEFMLQAEIKDQQISSLKSKLQDLKLQIKTKDQLIHSLEFKLQDLNNALLSLQRKFNGLEYDRQTAMKLAQDVNDSLSKVEMYHSNVERIGHVSRNVSVLRENISELLQIMNLSQGNKRREGVKPEPDTIFSSVEPERELLPHRIFVVVMDYDPHALCITGKPELELPVQSGSVVCVVGEMDENGYYKVLCNSNSGLVPANFVQEIELCDQELIRRLMDQDFTWGMERPDSEIVHELSFPKKERVKSEATVEMSSTEYSDVTDSAKVNSTARKQSCKIFLGLYDYDPRKSSSSETPEFELSFKEGSLLKIFGQKMSDGYYVGELNGKRGLVPADFIIDTTASHTKELSASLFLKSKKMTALYDYQPSKDSPNTYFDTELAFKAGDQITVYGNMHDDGFYSGQLGGSFGLVPSNFLKEQE